MAKGEKVQSKKPYAPPALKVYGNIRELTKRTGNAGQPDGRRRGRRNRTA